MKDATHKKNEPAPTDPFRELVTRIVQTPKAVVDKAEREYQKERKKHPKRGPKPG